ncbi:MAG: glycosyltransferase family 4 protein [bacterium]|nr:glycosyltransferase family 4 protein [bacterium]
MPTEKAHGIQLAKMCEAFVEHGIELELVVPDRKTSPQTIKDFYGLRVSIPVRKLPVIDWYGSSRIGFFIGSLSFAIGYFCYLLFKRIRGQHFIIYMTDIDQFSFFLIPFAGVPYVAEIHDAKAKRRAFVLLFRFASGIITINRIIKKELCATFGIEPQKVIVHPNGIDMSMFSHIPDQDSARNALQLPSDKTIIVYVGKFYEWKGLDVAIEAARVVDQNVDFYFVGGTQEELVHASGIREIPNNVHCVGHRTFTEIPIWLASADFCLVLGTKRNDYSYLHTSPMKFFEYMASNRPVIASRTPANTEIVSDAEVLMYEPDDVKDLAEKIHYALEHRKEMVERAERAYKKVNDFSWEKRAGSIIQFINSAI